MWNKKQIKQMEEPIVEEPQVEYDFIIHPGKVLISKDKSKKEASGKVDENTYTVEQIGSGVNNFTSHFPVKVGDLIKLEHAWGQNRGFNYMGKTYKIVQPGNIILILRKQ